MGESESKVLSHMGFYLGLPLVFPLGLTDLRIKAAENGTTLMRGVIIREQKAIGYPIEDADALELMLSVGPEGGARLGVRRLDHSRVRAGFTNRAHVDNLGSAREPLGEMGYNCGYPGCALEGH